MTGIPAPFDIIATMAVPARENIAPLERRACVPSKVSETVDSTDPMLGKRT